MRFFKKTRERLATGHKSVFVPPFHMRPHDRGTPKYLSGFYDLIHQEPYDTAELEKRGITEVGRKLYILATNILKHGISYLYEVEVAKEYFGEDFLHGVSATYDERVGCIRFVNMDDTEECIQFSKEMTYYVAKIFYQWMKDYHVYILWGYETFSFVPSTRANNPRYEVDYQARVFWA